jgi:hypothetical protein
VDELLARLEEVGRVVSEVSEVVIDAAIDALENADGTEEAERARAHASELLEAAKTEGGKAYPPEAFAYVPDPKTPSGWKLRLWSNPESKETADQVGRAVAALGSGFRGQKVDIPEADLPKVKARVLAAWKKVNPDKKEADVPAQLKEAGFMSYNDIRQRLSTALKSRMNVGENMDGPWVEDVYDDHLIYCLSGRYYQLDYTCDDKGTVTMGEPFEVMKKTVYEPIQAQTPAATPEALVDGISEIAGDVIPLAEAGVVKDGVVPVKIIQPGWGSSGYYSKEMLARDAQIYKPGTKMFWDHPTVAEERERPERSLRDLAGELVTAGAYDEQGAKGPGVYAQAKVFGPFKDAIEELAPHIGLSHRALGKSVKGEADGKKGPIIEKLVAAKSVDFVTTPGAGGEVVQMFEAARTQANGADTADTEPEDTHIREEAKRMDDEKVKELEEAKKTLEDERTKLVEENQRLKEAQVLREAHDLSAEKVGASDLPEITKNRLIETLSKSPVMKDGALDVAEYGKAIDEAIKAESDYIAKLTGAGKIKGMGTSGNADDKAKLKETVKANFQREGKSAEEAERMAEIFVSGR